MEHSHKDLYSVLKVSRSASPEQIRSAYREMAKAFHESANKDDALDATSEEKSAFTRTLRDVTNAFNILSNPVRRAEYDSQLAPLVDGAIPGLNQGTWSNGHRRGRSNETEFIAIKPTVAPAKPPKDKTSLTNPVTEIKSQNLLKASPVKEEKVPLPMSTKKLHPKLMAVIIVSSLSLGIVLAFVVRNALNGG